METFRECSDVIAMRNTIERLKQWGCVDTATGLVSHRIVEDLLEQRVQEMQRFGWPFGVMMIEVDLLQEVAACVWGQGPGPGDSDRGRIRTERAAHAGYGGTVG